MLKSLTNFFKSDNAKWIFVLIVVCIVFYSLMNYSQGKGMVLDAMTSVKPSESLGNEVMDTTPKKSLGTTAATVDESASIVPENSEYKSVDTAVPSDLLPTDKNSEFSNLNPANSGKPDMPDLLQAGTLIGVDTIGQTLRNANLQLRSDPVIEKVTVSPFLNSTIEPNMSQVPFELGCGKA